MAAPDDLRTLIAATIRTAIEEAYPEGIRACADRAADAVLAGFEIPPYAAATARRQIPEGMTSEKLQSIYWWLGYTSIHKAADDLRTEVRAWAAALAAE